MSNSTVRVSDFHVEFHVEWIFRVEFHVEKKLTFPRKIYQKPTVLIPKMINFCSVSTLWLLKTYKKCPPAADLSQPQVARTHFLIFRWDFSILLIFLNSRKSGLFFSTVFMSNFMSNFHVELEKRKKKVW